jgi:hypothetical protein
VIAEQVGVPPEADEVEELKRNVAPEAVLDAIQMSEQQGDERTPA